MIMTVMRIHMRTITVMDMITTMPTMPTTMPTPGERPQRMKHQPDMPVATAVEASVSRHRAWKRRGPVARTTQDEHAP